MKKTDFSSVDQEIKKLAEQIESVGHGRYRSYEIFRWLLCEILTGFGLKPDEPAMPDGVASEIRSLIDRYFSAVKRERPYTDILGLVYMILSTGGAKSMLGQFFTPQPISDMMALMLFDDEQPKDSNQLITVCDPAAGSGVMTLSFCRTVCARLDADSLKRYSITMIDIDIYCAYMCAVQFLTNIYIHQHTIGEIVVYRGNSLGDLNNLQVILHATGKHVPLPTIAPAKHPTRLRAISNSATSQGAGEQTSLFDSDGA